MATASLAGGSSLYIENPIRRAEHGAMHGQMFYLPLTPAFFSLLVAVFIVLFLLVQIGILRYAYMSLGLSPGAAFLLLIGSLLGSYFNIPVYELPQQQLVAPQDIYFFGMHYAMP